MGNLREGEKQYSIAIIIRNILLYMAVMGVVDELTKTSYMVKMFGSNIKGALVAGGFFIAISLIITFFKRKRYINPVKNYLKTLMWIVIINSLPIIYSFICTIVFLINR